MKVAVVGSSTLTMERVVDPLLSELTKLTPGTIVLLRRPAHFHEPIGAFEQMTARICKMLGDLYVTWYEPDVEEFQGRAATFERDIRMARDGDSVIAFFPEGEVMTGGTGHVVEKFHDVGKPSECFAVGEAGAYWAGGMTATV
jgi:hypothetical protein